MNKNKFNHNKLLGRIKEMFGSNAAFIEKITMSEPSFYKKLQNGYFNTNEILEFCKLLNISDDEIYIYFFCKES